MGAGDPQQPDRAHDGASPRKDAPNPTPASGVRLAPRVSVPEAELEFTYARSGGPGGQNVNTRSTKATLRVRIEALPMSGRARDRLRTLAGSLVTNADELLISSDEHRTQARNRGECLDRLRELVARALVVPKVRKKTKPSRGAVERRLRAKREQGERKARRKRVDE